MHGHCSIDGTIATISYSFDTREFGISDWYNLRLKVPEMYWEMVEKNLIPEHHVFAIELDLENGVELNLENIMDFTMQPLQAPREPIQNLAKSKKPVQTTFFEV